MLALQQPFTTSQHSQHKDVSKSELSCPLLHVFNSHLSVIYNADHNYMPPPDDSAFSANYKIIIPIVLSLLILLGLIATVLIIRKKSIWSLLFFKNKWKFILFFSFRIIVTKSHPSPITIWNTIDCEHHEQRKFRAKLSGSKSSE